MTLNKVETAIKLIKAQVSFLATQQKDRKSINKNIIAYGKVVTAHTLRHKTLQIGEANKSVKTSGSQLTFEVYAHLNNKDKKYF